MYVTKFQIPNLEDACEDYFVEMIITSTFFLLVLLFFKVAFGRNIGYDMINKPQIINMNRKVR